MYRLFCLILILITFKLDLKGQVPVANFTQNITSGCGNLVVKFTDLSTGNPTSWLWDFGDGTAPSTFQNPTHAYLTPGIFNVTLTVSNANGSNTITKHGLIKVFPNPTVNFTSSTTNGCVPFDVAFFDNTTSSVPLKFWSWNFGDGSYSNIQNPIHTYTTTGNYTVSLSVIDSNGCQASLSRSFYIKAETAQIPQFTANVTESCNTPFVVEFNNLTSGNNLSFLWLFGDGTTSNSINPIHTYLTHGQYDVSLISTTAAGCSDTITKIDYIKIHNFQASFTSSSPQGCYPLTVNFYSNQQTTNVLWHFGDGDTSNVLNPVHIYQLPGNYTVTVVAQNSFGCRDTLIALNYVSVGEGISIDFSVSDSLSCITPFIVNFNASVNGSYQYYWDFGDGGFSSSPNPTHSYNNEGTYTVSLKLIDSMGCISQITKTNLIKIFKPIAHFTGYNLFGCDSVFATFEDSTISTSNIVSWVWDFGDGSPLYFGGPVVQHLYNDTGRFSVKLKIENVEGCQDSVVRYFLVGVGKKPSISFYADDTSDCYPFTAFFTADVVPQNSFVMWRFGDGQTGFGDTISHLFNDTGFFSVRVIANHHGCIDSLTKDNYIYVKPPKALFTADSNYFCQVPHLVVFHNQSHGGNKWLWDFGDGTTDTTFSPVHLYTINGLFNVILYATDTLTNCTDSLVMQNFVGISEIKAGFVIDTNVICRRTPLTFTDTSIHYFQIIDRIWHYGNGYNQHVSNATHQYFYDTSGVFSIKLVIEDAIGCKDSVEYSNLITVNPLPTAGFVASPLQGCKPLTVDFHVIQEADSIVSAIWNFGDNATAASLSPTHIYQATGNYNVSATLTNIYGCDSTFVKNNYITVTYPMTFFTVNDFSQTQQPIVCHYNSVKFNNHTTGIGLNYYWNFGDGTFSNEISPEHHYIVDSTKTFDVILLAIDTNGCDSSYAVRVTISHPIADFSASSTISDCPPFLASFINKSSNDVISWYWNFGDSLSGSSNFSIISNPVHEYMSAGYYDVSLIVSNTYNCKDTIVKTNFIKVNGPSGSFTYMPLGGCAPSIISFEATATNTAQFHWLFGDGNLITTTNNSIEYFYNNGGTFTPVLLLEDSLTSQNDTTTCIVTLIGNNPIKIISAKPDFLVSGNFFCTPDTVRFTDISTSNYPINSWYWNFGDGSFSTEQNPLHFYQTPGNYNVVLTVTSDTCRFSDTLNTIISIFNPPPFLWTVSDSEHCNPLSVKFIPLNYSFFNQLEYWQWNFGNGQWADTITTPQTVYYNSGDYSVTFFAKFLNGCTESYLQQHRFIVHPQPIADFTYTKNPSYFVNNEVLFYPIEDQNTVKFYWDFGDGHFSSDKNPLHNYQFAGNYDVTLIMENIYECSDTITKTIIIEEKQNLPNAFTPNSDGKNDLFLRGLPLTIMNRWGVVIYEGMEGWDGKYKNEPVPEGTYFYIVTLTNAKGEQKKINGTVTIIWKRK